MRERPNGVAPTFRRYKVGGKGGVVAEAWQWMWDRLTTEEFVDGRTLSEQAAAAFPKVKAITLSTHLYRMAEDGVLESELRPVNIVMQRAGQEFATRRNRAHFRIKQSHLEKVA